MGENDKESTLYDSVGIGLEDYSALIFYELANKYNWGRVKFDANFARSQKFNLYVTIDLRNCFYL